MNARHIVVGLGFFAACAALGLALAVLAPIPQVRILGLIGMSCAMAGVVLQLLELRISDPHALMVLRFRTRAAYDKTLGAFLHRVRPLTDVAATAGHGHS